MGTYPVRYSSGEIICIGDVAELTLPDGQTRRIRIGSLNSDAWNRAEGREHPHDIPRLNLEHLDHELLWNSSLEAPAQRLNPAGLRLIARSDKLYYNDGREMNPATSSGRTGKNSCMSSAESGAGMTRISAGSSLRGARRNSFSILSPGPMTAAGSPAPTAMQKATAVPPWTTSPSSSAARNRAHKNPAAPGNGERD